MAKRDSHWELNIQTGIEVQQASFNKAAKIFDNFYNKYNDQKMQVDTSDLVKTVRDSISEIQKLYKEGTMDGSGWLQLRPELKASFEAILSDAEEMFRGIKVLFNDGSYVSGFEDILRGFNNQMSIVFSDIGGLYDELNEKQRSLVDTLGGLSLPRYVDQSEMRDRIDALQELIDVQNEMASINQNISKKDFASGYDSDGLMQWAKSYRGILEDMLDFELNTVDQVVRRRELIDGIKSIPYDDDSHYYTKEDKNYKESIANLEEYIKNKQVLMEELENTEGELFRTTGIEGYQAELRGQINTLDGYKKELEGLMGDGTDGPVNINMTEVVEQLKEIKQVIGDLADAFKPLTDAFSREDSALSAMVKANVADLETLNAKVEETFQNIEALSKKNFNVTNTNVLQQTISNPGSALKAQKDEAKAIAKELGEWAKAFSNMQGVLTKVGITGADQLNLLAFNPDEVIKGIRGAKGENQLAGWIDVIEDYKTAVVSAAKVLEKHGYKFNLDMLFNAGKQQDNRVLNIEETNANVNNILTEVKSIRDKIQEEVNAIRQSFEDIFKFDGISPNYDAITTITDTIYKQFADLKDKIDALDLNLNIPAITIVGDGTNKPQTDTTSADGVQKATDAINEEGTAAEEASLKKEKFIEANKEVANSGDATKEGIEGATDAITKEGKAAGRAADQIADALKRIDDAVKNKPVMINGTSYEDFQNFAMTLASSNNMKIDDVSVVADGDDSAKLATIKMVNEELAQSVVYTYKLSDAEDAIVTAYLERYKASSNVNKALKMQLAEQKRLDKERAKNNQFLIKQQEALDAQERRYKHSKKTVDGSTSLMSTETSLAADAEQTIDSLAKHIRDRIKSVVGGELTDTLREEILNDIRILKNEISVAQNDKYSATTMKASSVKTNVKAYEQYLNAFEANAKKGHVFEKMEEDIKSLREELGKVEDSPALDNFIDNLKVARNKLAAEKAKYAQESAESKENEQQYDRLIKLQDKLYKAKKQLAQVDAGSAKGMEKARAVKELQAQYDEAVKLLKNSEDRAKVQARINELEKELSAVRLQSQNSYGKTIFNRESRHFDTIAANRSSMGDKNLSVEFIDKIDEYETAYNNLKKLREEIINNPSANSSPITQKAFQSAALEVEKLRKEIIATFNEAKKFDQIASSGSLIDISDFDASKVENLRAAMIEFGASIEDGKLKFQGFNDAGTEMYGTIDRGAGVVEKVTVALRAGTNQLYAYKDGTKQVQTSWQQLGGSLKKTAAQFATMYLSFHDIIRYLRQGIKYVKEIDLAMTELKKVTNETDQTYKDFLKDASNISNVIGSTVSDFTDATAAFARLGYSISESTNMAKTAIVYKNVADGLDTVEESTDSIISTMKAYGIASNDTMGIIDRFNAVGNNFAITSAGIGEAMQRSASALYEGGNSIDETIGLITAANSVIQNPEQVGKMLADYKVA